MQLDRFSIAVGGAVLLGASCGSPQLPNNFAVIEEGNVSPQNPEGTPPQGAETEPVIVGSVGGLCQTECLEGYDKLVGPGDDVCPQGQEGCLESGMTLDELRNRCNNGIITAIQRHSRTSDDRSLYWVCVDKRDYETCGIYGYLVEGKDRRSGEIVEACTDTPAYEEVRLDCAHHNGVPIKVDCQVIGDDKTIPMWDCLTEEHIIRRCLGKEIN